MLAKVYVTLKKGVFDPQGETVNTALKHMGYNEVKGIRVGKYIEVNLFGDDVEKETARLEEMCQKLLANPVIESYRFEIE
jgi:phosphoribosylformylglycinamidine synthase subunit PurS